MAEDRTVLTAEELDRMTPDERAAAFAARVVTDMSQIPESFRSRLLETGERIAASRRSPTNAG